MFGKRYFQEQSNVPSLPQASTHQSDLPLKYEYEPYGMHHGPALSHNIDGHAVGPLGNKHQPSHMSQPEMKYSCSLDFVRQNRVNDLVNHNHTYTLPQGSGASPRPQARDKKQRRLDEEHLSRDEKRARALNVSVRKRSFSIPFWFRHAKSFPSQNSDPDGRPRDYQFADGRIQRTIIEIRFERNTIVVDTGYPTTRKE